MPSRRFTRENGEHDEEREADGGSLMLSSSAPSSKRRSYGADPSSSSSSSSSAAAAAAAAASNLASGVKRSRVLPQQNAFPSRDDGDDEEEEDDDEDPDAWTFTQQPVPEQSQGLQDPKKNEVANAEKLTKAVKSKLVADMVRYFLLKGFKGEAIEKSKAVNDVLMDYKAQRVGPVILAEAAKRMKELYGFELKKAPNFMTLSLPTKMRERFYVINQVDVDGEELEHMSAIQRGPQSGDMGFLVACLLIIYNKGQLRDGANVKWLSEDILYQKLHFADQEIPKDPPKGKSSAVPEGLSADVPSLLSQFVAGDYLLSHNFKTDTGNDVINTLCYAMGPRAALEVGRRQLIFMAAELLDEKPDQAMLNELDNEEAVDDEEEADEGGGD